MKIGVSAFAWTTEIGPAHLRLLPALRQHGIDAFEIPMFHPAQLDVRAIREACQASGMECTVCAILPAGVQPLSPDQAEQAKATAHLTHCIEAAAEMGAHRVGGPIYAPIGHLPGRRRTHDEWGRFVDCLQALTPLLDRHDITLAIEPVNRSESYFLNTTADLCALCDEVGHPRVGALIDTFHANIEDKNIASSVRLAGPRLKHLHASENDRGLLGSGHVDFPAIVAALREVNYDGYLMIEGFGYSPSEPRSLGALWGDLNVSPEDIACKGADYLHALLAASV